MKLTGDVLLSSTVLHRCGEYLKWELEVNGDAPEMAMREGRFTFVSYFAKNALHFKAHGTRIKRCPGCQQTLPTTVEQWNDSEFKQEEGKS